MIPQQDGVLAHHEYRACGNNQPEQGLKAAFRPRFPAKGENARNRQELDNVQPGERQRQVRTRRGRAIEKAHEPRARVVKPDPELLGVNNVCQEVGRNNVKTRQTKARYKAKEGQEISWLYAAVGFGADKDLIPDKKQQDRRKPDGHRHSRRYKCGITQRDCDPMNAVIKAAPYE